MRIVACLVSLMIMVMPARAEPITVFAAASLKNAFDQIAAGFTRDTGYDVVVSYAGTSLLARQIEQGAPADVFASAHPDWMAYLLERTALDEASITAFASNALVLIAPADTSMDAPFDLTSLDAIEGMLGAEGRLAVALVDAVPAGLYARQALESLGFWDALEVRLAQSDNVRAALQLVARGEAPLGIVYASDAHADERVQVLAQFPVAAHAPIIYSAARVSQSGMEQVDGFLAFLQGDQAQATLADNGFLPAAGE